MYLKMKDIFVIFDNNLYVMIEDAACFGDYKGKIIMLEKNAAFFPFV